MWCMLFAVVHVSCVCVSFGSHFLFISFLSVVLISSLDLFSIILDYLLSFTLWIWYSFSSIRVPRSLIVVQPQKLLEFVWSFCIYLCVCVICSIGTRVWLFHCVLCFILRFNIFICLFVLITQWIWTEWISRKVIPEFYRAFLTHRIVCFSVNPNLTFVSVHSAMCVSLSILSLYWIILCFLV